MMNTNILATAAGLSDQGLLARLEALAVKERETSVELVAHLVALDARPSAYAAKGYGSLFGYCTRALRLSEDAACNRIEAARACRRFPVILDLLASGTMSLTCVRMLGRYLTPENHQAVLARARGRTLRQINVLVAELAPRADITSSLRKLPTLTATPAASPTPIAAATGVPSSPPPAIAPSLPVFVPTRPIVQATAPERYRVQFTIGEETHEKLRRVQDLMRREIPSGDPGAIFDRALTLLLAKVEKAKLGKADRPRPPRSIRRETDEDIQTLRVRSRGIPRAVRRAVWKRDGGQCAFVSPDGRRCTERTYLESHHVQPYATQGPATVENISLRCRRHNQYEAELVFGPHGVSTVREPRELFARAAPDGVERRPRWGP
jgi:5-methylcytosine-specific restriction endonuclease McrA